MLATNITQPDAERPGRSREDKGTEETAHCGETDSAGDKEYTIDENVSYD